MENFLREHLTEKHGAIALLYTSVMAVIVSNQYLGVYFQYLGVYLKDPDLELFHIFLKTKTTVIINLVSTLSKMQIESRSRSSSYRTTRRKLHIMK